MTSLITIVTMIYVASGIVSYGMVYHYFQERFKCFAWPNRWRYRLAATAAGVVGPVGFLYRLLISLRDKDKVCWRLRYRTVTPDESWDTFHRNWPNLTRDYWENF